MKLNKKGILIITSGALLIQLLIITYNSLTGFIYVPDFKNFLERLIIGTSFSALGGLAIVAVDLKIINFLEGYLDWTKNTFVRFLAELFSVAAAGVTAAILITLSANIIFPYKESLLKTIIDNSLIVIVINIIIIGVLEAIIFFRRNQQSKIEAERLLKENAQFKFEMLKRQLNPHFLFNSLNVLSALIKVDAEKAQNFIDEFSYVYRYTLDVIDKKIIELKQEISFVKSYLFLQSIRFEDAVVFEINISADKLEYFVPPLALQTLLENAFKHNKAVKENPLKIKIYDEENYLVVRNNLQPKNNFGESSKVGLKNLEKRYKFITGSVPVFSVTKDEYIAKIPIIEME